MSTEQIKFISLQHLKRMQETGEPFRLIDVRSREDYVKEHIGGAIHIPLEEIERARELLKPSDNIITYCESFVCSASSSAAVKLMRMGFGNVRDYKGGLREWKMNDLPTESGP